MITHHLNDQLLMAYSAGTLPEAFNLVVATHIAICDECRARLESFDAIGGALIEESLGDAPEQLGSDALAQTLARIKTSTPEPRKRAAAQPPRDRVLPEPLRSYLGGGVDSINWRPVGGGVKQAILPTSENATARMLFIPAGAAVPDHGHAGMELTLVLQGAFADGHDRFARGDIEIADEDLHHQPMAEPGLDCICLAATDAPLRFRGLLPRLAQPFLQI
ncbi:MAG: transcriptional regulator [Rhodobacteraceae bacterium]|nr:MAG: transcriptional regulator [Paracoccaceae bacterium]